MTKEIVNDLSKVSQLDVHLMVKMLLEVPISKESVHGSVLARDIPFRKKFGDFTIQLFCLPFQRVHIFTPKMTALANGFFAFWYLVTTWV